MKCQKELQLLIFLGKQKCIEKGFNYTYLYSFEIDTLEIVLKEHVDVVDKIFIGENQF